jgi:hypothetical protein
MGHRHWQCRDSGDSDILCRKRQQSGEDSVIELQLSCQKVVKSCRTGTTSTGTLRHPRPRDPGFTDRPRAMMAARGLEREARRTEGCHHGPRADRETQEPEGGGGVMT